MNNNAQDQQGGLLQAPWREAKFKAYCFFGIRTILGAQRAQTRPGKQAACEQWAKEGEDANQCLAGAGATAQHPKRGTSSTTRCPSGVMSGCVLWDRPGRAGRPRVPRPAPHERARRGVALETLHLETGRPVLPPARRLRKKSWKRERARDDVTPVVVVRRQRHVRRDGELSPGRSRIEAA